MAFAALKKYSGKGIIYFSDPKFVAMSNMAQATIQPISKVLNQN